MGMLGGAEGKERGDGRKEGRIEENKEIMRERTEQGK